MTENHQNREWWKDRGPRRAGWLVTTIALGIALVAASVANYRGAQAAFDTLNRGQIELLENAIRQTMFGPGDDEVALDSALVQQSAAGLRYIAILDGTGAVQAEAGEAAAPVALPPNYLRGARATGIVSVEVEGRVRAFLPRLNESRRSFGFGRSPSASETSEGPRPLPFGHLLIEFEPVVASQLMTRAARSLALGTVAALLLSIAAVGFWRQSVQHEKARREFEQRRRLSQLGEMSAVLAHEIRNPLASLKGNAQLLAERLPAGSRDRSKADRVVAEATRLEALTTDLLEFARSGPNESMMSDPGALAASAIEEVSEGEIALDASAAPASWPFDPERLRHALVNILRNAVQASPEQAPQLTILERDGELVFEVRDFGEGIPEGVGERLFDPFFTTRTNGTGLGLAVARRAVEAHDGRIEATNHPDGGAVFRLVLPRAHG